MQLRHNLTYGFVIPILGFLRLPVAHEQALPCLLPFLPHSQKGVVTASRDGSRCEGGGCRESREGATQDRAARQFGLLVLHVKSSAVMLSCFSVVVL
jgi:hypothetical protein